MPTHVARTNLSGGTRISSYFSSFYVSRATRVFRVFLTHWDHGQALLKIAKKYVVKKLEKITVNDVFVFILQSTESALNTTAISQQNLRHTKIRGPNKDGMATKFLLNL